MASYKTGAVRLTLAPSAEVPSLTAPWIFPLLKLGTRAAFYSRKIKGCQLVIAVTVPKRDYAAALISCGWVLASKAPVLAEPLVALRDMKPGQPLRAVNKEFVITGNFTSLDEAEQPPRANFAGSVWKVNGIRALALLNELDRPIRTPRPDPGSIEHMGRLSLMWDARLAKPAADLAIVGTITWLEEDFKAFLHIENDNLPSSKIESLLMPKSERSATWFTRLFASVRLAENLPLPRDLNAVILDGNTAAKYLAEIETPVVICVLDRSSVEDTAAQMLIQLRNTRSNPISLAENLDWKPPSGVEAIGFTVPL